jgi:hypothetical protein
MRSIYQALVLLLLLTFGAGCSGDRDKGVYKGEGKPLPPEKKDTKS